MPANVKNRQIRLNKRNLLRRVMKLKQATKGAIITKYCASIFGLGKVE